METQVWPTWCLQLQWPVCKDSCLQPEAFCFGTWRDKRESFPRKTDLKQRGRKCVGQLSWHFECLRLPFGSALSWPSFRWQFWRKPFEMLWQRRRCKCIHLPTVSKNRCFYRMAYTMSIFSSYGNLKAFVSFSSNSSTLGRMNYCSGWFKKTN